MLQTLKYTNSELKRCDLGESTVMKGYLSCTNINSTQGVFNTMQALIGGEIKRLVQNKA